MSRRLGIDEVELSAILILHLALIPIALICWVVFTALAVDAGMDPGPIEDPILKKAFTPVGYLLWSAPFAIMSVVAWVLVWILHTFVARPLVEGSWVEPRQAQVRKDDPH